MTVSNSIELGGQRNSIKSIDGLNNNGNKMSDLKKGLFQNCMSQYETSNKQDAAKKNSGDLMNHYMSYQYKDNQVQKKDQITVGDKLEQSKNTIEQTGNKIIETVADDLGLEEDEIILAMENMGISPLELLQPENLVNLVSEIMGTTDTAELLVNPDFQLVLSDLGKIQGDFFAELELTPQQVDEVMELLNTQDEAVLQKQEVVSEETTVMMNEPIENSGEMEHSDLIDDQIQIKENDIPADIMKNQGNTESENKNMETEIESDDLVVEKKNTSANTNNGTFESTENDMNQHSGLNASEMMVNENLNAENIEQPVAQSPYSQTVDTMELIRQVAEKVRISSGADFSTMEMQLNPENLGKLYLEISSKQGNVHAQIAAQNEAVKNALQSEMVMLQERLEQAGVKVDAIEITVATHEFERNLEQDQNQQNAQTEAEKTGNQKSNRKNLNLNDLDEISGVMTEEETLVAQIMKDNGNSVDFTA